MTVVQVIRNSTSTGSGSARSSDTVVKMTPDGLQYRRREPEHLIGEGAPDAAPNDCESIRGNVKLFVMGFKMLLERKKKETRLKQKIQGFHPGR